MSQLNALADLSVINNAADYINTHGTAIKPELFYNKVLLDTIRLGTNHYVHYGLAELKPIQGRAEKLQLRRWSPLAAHTVPLSEGIPPKSDKGTMESWELGVAQYGRYMEFTDKVEWNIIDPIITHYTAEYSKVAVETLDLLAREALMAVPNVYFAGDAANLGELEIDAAYKPSLADWRVVVLGMKKRLVKPRMGNKYMVIGTPDVFFDMVTDPIVEKYLTINQSTKNVYQNTMLPDLFDMTFSETMAYDDSSEFTTVVPTSNPAVVSKALRVFRSDGAGGYEYAIAYEKTTAGAATGFLVTDTDVMLGDKWRFPNAELNAVPSHTYWDLDAYNTANQGAGAEWQALKVHPVLILGANALIRTNVEGRDNAKMYVKPLGSAGVLDPINQRQSIGFKIDAVGFGVERTDAVAIYYCVPTQSNV